MNISSTPFIRNDYWPDYNDINQLNQRINEVENELSLTNIRLSTDIENVSNNLNSYADNQANTTIANNIIVNNINANYAVGKFVNFGNANFNNAYVENLTVNKPVFDITLNTPHIENVTSLGGNIYDANLFNVSITGGNVAFNNVSIDDLTAVNATISNVNILDGEVNLNKAIIDNVNASNAVISNVNILDGNININKAAISDINAANAIVSNLFVNTQPEPVTSSAVLGYDSEGRVIPIHASFDVGFPEDANYLYTDHAGTAFAGIAATEVSTVNNLITAQAVQNGFNNLAEEEQIDMNNIVSHILPYSVVNFFNSSSPLNYQGITDVNYNAGSFVSDYYLGNNVYMRLNDTTLEFSLPALTSDLFYTVQSNMYITNNKSMRRAFYGCQSLNQNIIIPNGITNIVSLFGTFDDFDYEAFGGSESFNQNIRVPDSVINMSNAFVGCSIFNQNILVPNSVNSMDWTFACCYNFNQNILIPNSVTHLEGAFYNCTSLNQNILIPNSVISMAEAFGECTNFNQNITLPNGLDSLYAVFYNCNNLNQNLLIPDSVTNMRAAFSGCNNLNQNILIPPNVRSIARTFISCESLNQNIYIYSDKLDALLFDGLLETFKDCRLLTDKYIHIRSSIPMDTSNVIYNSLVNNYTGINWAGRVLNDLEEPTQWPPEA